MSLLSTSSIPVCQQALLQAPLFERRRALVEKIPNFWPLVLEQAPPDIDQFIQPSDSTICASFLKRIDVTRFEVPPAAPTGSKGDPRSVAIKFEFEENEWFEDTVLEKKFWYRRALDGWTGLVSEPIKIRWKKGKDLTQGLTDAAYAAWKAEQGASATSNGRKDTKRLPEQEAVIQKMEKVSEGSMSFFSWFGYRGRHITAEESTAANAKEKERREKAKQGEKEAPEAEEEDALKEEAIETEMRMEIFPPGEDLAMAISEDLFPGALKYFSKYQVSELL